MQLLVGRERELSKLRNALELARQSNGSLVLVSGEAGIGKTSLVRAVASEATERGALVLNGAAYDLSANPPYGPWLEITDRYRPDSDLPDLPDVLMRGSGIGVLQSQVELFEVVRGFFVQVSQTQPVVLVLEDLHWADQASMDLLRYLTRQIQSHRILLVATYRDDEITRRHHLFQMIPLLVRESQAQRIDLKALDAAAIGRLTKQRLDLEQTELDILADYLLRWAEGNPLFTEELLRALEREGVLQRSESGWHLGNLPTVPVPNLIRQMVERRMSDFSDASYQPLQTAAVIGQAVPFELWELLHDAETVAHAASEALDAQLVTESDDGQGIEFRHALIREAIYESLALPHRRVTHRRVAEAYLERAKPDPEPVAYHLQQAGDPRAAEWLIQAGTIAEDQFAFVQAHSRYDTAIEFLQRVAGTEKLVIGVQIKIGNILHQLDPRLSTAYYQSARQAALDTGELAAAGFALICIGTNTVNLGNPSLGLQEMRDGLAEMDGTLTDMDDATRWGVHLYHHGIDPHPIALGISSYMLSIYGRLREAVDVAEQCTGTNWRDARDPRRFPDVASRDRGLSQAYHGLGVALSNLGHADDGRLAYRLMDETFRLLNVRHPYQLMTTMSYILRQHLPYRTDDLDERRRLMSLLEDWIGLSARAMNPATATSVYELCLLYTGRWADLGQIKESGHEPPIFGNWSVSMAARARLALHQGDFVETEALLRKLLPDGAHTEPDDQPHPLPGYAPRIAVELALERGDLDGARQWLQMHDDWLDWSGAILGRAEGSLLWAKLHLAEGNIDAARDCAGQALERASDPRQPMALIAVHRFLGELATHVEDLDTADERMTQSRDLVEKCDLPFERALTVLAQAELAIASGDREGALRFLDDVRQTTTDLGARPTLDRANNLLSRLSPRGAKSRFGVTRRELDVLQLIVQGKTDREIAEELFIAPNTVMNHVSSILRKLNVDSRTAAATQAVRRDLV